MSTNELSAGGSAYTDQHGEAWFTDWLRDQLDSYGPELSPQRVERIGGLFKRTVSLEAAFFDAAYGYQSTEGDR